MRRRLNRYAFPPWLRKFIATFEQFLIPFCIFQGVRTLIFPTIFDILFLAILILITIGFRSEII